MKHLTVYLAAALLAVCCANPQPKEMKGDFLTLAKERYSVRSFSSTPVPQSALDSILTAGMVAPTAMNSQPQKVYVVRTADLMARMDEASPCIYGAPSCFVFCYDESKVCPRGEGDNYGEMDVTIIFTHMMLEAADLGLGTCCVGRFDRDMVREILSIPEGIQPILIMPFGYPSEDAAPSIRHSQYRPLEETVEFR